MQRVMAIAVVQIGLLFSAPVKADDAKTEPVRIKSVSDLVAPSESLYTADWQLEIDDLEFQDNSPLGRISRMRELSLLTLAETQNSRFFLGVNSEGTFGLHFNAR